MAEPSRLVGAAERVTRRVLLQGEKGKGQHLRTRGVSPAPRLWDVWAVSSMPATARTQGPALPCEAQPGPLATVGRYKCKGSKEEGTQGEVFKQVWFCNKGQQKSDDDDVLIPICPR